MNQSRSENRNTWQRARACLRSGLLLTTAAMAYMSGGASLAFAQGIADNMTGSWRQTNGGSAIRFTGNEMSMYQGAKPNSPAPTNLETIKVNGNTFYKVWTASYKGAGNNLSVDIGTLKPSKDLILENCKALGGREPDCYLSEKYVLTNMGGGATIQMTGTSYYGQGPMRSWINFFLAREEGGKPSGAEQSGLKGGFRNVDVVKDKKYYSANSQYYFVWQSKDSNLCLRKANDEYVWSLDKIYPRFSDIQTLQLQPDGNLVARNAAGGFLWSPLNANNQNPPNSPTELIATNDGRLGLIHRPTRNVLWNVP